MRIPCPLCGESVTLKRLARVVGLEFLRGGEWVVPRVCVTCNELPESEHWRLFEEELGR